MKNFVKVGTLMFALGSFVACGVANEQESEIAGQPVVFVSQVDSAMVRSEKI